jgi:hypothetical protein
VFAIPALIAAHQVTMFRVIEWFRSPCAVLPCQFREVCAASGVVLWSV